MARGSFIVTLSALIAVVPGCCGCKVFHIKIQPHESLRETYGVPLDIYFAPPDEVEDLQGVRNAEWFQSKKEELVRKLVRQQRRQMLVSVTARPDHDDRVPPVTNLPREVATIFAWGGLPDTNAEKNLPAELDAEQLETSTLGIFTSSECSFVVEVRRNEITIEKTAEEP